MGLDMYLTAKKSAYGSSYSNQEQQDAYKQAIQAFGLPPDWRCEESPSSTIKLNIAYWRKANAIHSWFVKNVQDGIDECEESYVSTDKLKALIEACQTVLEDPTKAPQLLPTKNGFFFGGTEYDDGYREGLQNTVKQLTAVLDNPAFKGCRLYYRSSW